MISAGTVEEAQYQRQLYKQQMQNIGLNAEYERRYFNVRVLAASAAPPCLANT